LLVPVAASYDRYEFIDCHGRRNNRCPLWRFRHRVRLRLDRYVGDNQHLDQHGHRNGNPHVNAYPNRHGNDDGVWNRHLYRHSHGSWDDNPHSDRQWIGDVDWNVHRYQHHDCHCNRDQKHNVVADVGPGGDRDRDVIKHGHLQWLYGHIYGNVYRFSD
jgi:hypothetical protein